MGAKSEGSRLGKDSASSSSLWFASNPSKRWGEIFFLSYTPFWLTLCLGIVVPYKLYENFSELEYLLLGLISAVPSLLIPIVLVGKADRSLCWKDRYWVKASLWIVIFSYVGNYFWTHYFFTVLGASYTFPSWRMNNVPHTTFLLTHVCFLFYHVVSNITLRRLQHSIADLPGSMQLVFKAGWILALSYFVAYLETVAISNFLMVSLRSAHHWGWFFGYYKLLLLFLEFAYLRCVCLGQMRYGSSPSKVHIVGVVFSAITSEFEVVSYIIYSITLDQLKFPYYSFVDQASMYKVGSLFYAIYFFVSFPMFLRVDEKPGDLWDLPRVAVDALGAAMLVTIILDLWRIFLGPIVPVPGRNQCMQPGLAWFS